MTGPLYGTRMDVSRSPREPVRGPVDWFTGEVNLDQLAVPGDPAQVRMAHVHFSAGARTAWHSHPLGQVLSVTEGSGQVQRRGGHSVVRSSCPRRRAFPCPDSKS